MNEAANFCGGQVCEVDYSNATSLYCECPAPSHVSMQLQPKHMMQHQYAALPMFLKNAAAVACSAPTQDAQSYHSKAKIIAEHMPR
jgi:hypothetical protein